MTMSKDKPSPFKFKTYNATQPHRTAGVSDEIWERHERIITQMHNNKITVTSMLERLKREHGFEPSFGQLARKLKGWGLRKYRRRGSRSTDDDIEIAPEQGLDDSAHEEIDMDGTPDTTLDRVESRRELQRNTQTSCTSDLRRTDQTHIEMMSEGQVDVMITSLSMSPQSYSSFREYAQTLSQTLSSELQRETGKPSSFSLDRDAGGDTYMLSTPSSWNFERATGLGRVRV